MFRLTLVLAGLSAVIVGMSAVTGGWLGSPPWAVTGRDLTREESERAAAYQTYRSAYLEEWALEYRQGWIEPTYRPGAPLQRSEADFAVPVRWATWVPDSRRWIGAHSILYGFLLAAGAASTRGRPRLDMGRVARFTGVGIGLVTVVYGVSTLTGVWLGTPPWWKRPEPYLDWLSRTRAIDSPDYGWEDYWRREGSTIAVGGRTWISAAVIAAGVGLAAVGARTRRRRAAPAP